MLRLKMAIDREVYSTNLAKFEILIKGFFKLFFTTRWELHSETEERQNNEDSSETSYLRDQRRLMDGSEHSINYGTPEQNAPEAVLSPAESSRVQVRVLVFYIGLYSAHSRSILKVGPIYLLSFFKFSKPLSI